MRRFQILNKDVDKVVSLLKSGGKVTKDVLPDVMWAHKAPLKLVRMKHGKIHLFAEEAGAWKQVVSVDDRDVFLRDALLNANSDVPLTRDNGTTFCRSGRSGCRGAPSWTLSSASRPSR